MIEGQNSTRRAEMVIGKQGNFWRMATMGAALFAAVALALVALAISSQPAESRAKLPNGFAAQRVASGLEDPTAMAVAPDGRIFVSEQRGTLRVIKNGRLLPRPFAKFDVNSEGERGLLGIAFDPDFERNNHVYVYYTKRGKPVHNRVVRLTARGDRAVGGERLILRLNALKATNHNGGAINFARDGKLYVAVGENARPQEAQSLKNLHGKMLRINKDGSIPRDNPFYNRAVGKNRAIWARGLRNPFTFGVQPGTNRIFINDVGGRTWEEINAGRRGGNYGWPRYEGPERDRRFNGPIHAYRHEGRPGGCAIAGGAFYTDDRFPGRFRGDYFYADLCGGYIRGYDLEKRRSYGFATGINRPVDLRVDRGHLYYLERGSGSAFRVRFAG